MLGTAPKRGKEAVPVFNELDGREQLKEMDVYTMH